MATTLQEVAQRLHAFFADKVPGGGGDSPGDAVLVFDALGTPFDPDEFGAALEPGAQTVFASQRAAQIADRLPAANILTSGSWLARSGSRLSRFYEAAVRESRPTSTADDDVTSFERRKADALHSLDENKLLDVAMPGAGVAPLGTTDSHFATLMSPTGWYRTASADFAVFTEAEASETPLPEQPPVLPIPEFELLVVPPEEPDPLVLRWLDQARNLAELPREAEVLVGPPVPPERLTAGELRLRIADVVERGARLHAFRAADEPAGGGDDLRFAVARRPVFFNGETTTAVIRAAVQHPVVESQGFSLSFEYCVVAFERPWWDELFLAADGWRVPGFSPGQLASGKASQPAELITLVTAGMVVIRNLAIKANWQATELAAAQSASSLGPFVIAGSEWHESELRRPGLQAIAWLCQVPQVLPPRTGDDL